MLQINALKNQTVQSWEQKDMSGWQALQHVGKIDVCYFIAFCFEANTGFEGISNIELICSVESLM